MSECDFDLFGDPVRHASGRRGRPRHVDTQENHNKVIMLLACGWSNDRIAKALRISLPTLRAYYSSELKLRDMQRDRLDAARLMQAWAQAQTGNVGAMRLLDALIAKNDAVLAASSFQRPDKDEAPVGKKEEQRRAAIKAQSSDDEWGDDLNPTGMH